MELIQPASQAAHQHETDPRLTTQNYSAVALLGATALQLETNKTRQTFAYERLAQVTYLALQHRAYSQTRLTIYRTLHPPRGNSICALPPEPSHSITWLNEDTSEVGLIHFVPRPVLLIAPSANTKVRVQSAVWPCEGTNDYFIWHKSYGLDVIMNGGYDPNPEDIHMVYTIITEGEASHTGMLAILRHMHYTRVGHVIPNAQ